MNARKASSRLDLTGADGFVLALDSMMHNHGQHGLVGQTCVDLKGCVDVDRLRRAAGRLFEEHSLLTGCVTRSWLTLRPYWKVPAAPLPPRLVVVWDEEETGALLSETGESADDVDALCHLLLNRRLGSPEAPCNLHVDLVRRRSSDAVLVLTWSHILFDGKGAEMLVEELIAMDQGSDAARCLPRRPKAKFSAMLKQVIAVGKHFGQLSQYPIRSLSGPHPQPGRLCFKMTHLDETQTTQVRSRAKELTGPLFNLPFYLACAARAHRAVFRMRGKEPEHYIVSLPVQVRRKAQAESPFQNRVSIFFFHLTSADLETVESATLATQMQFEKMTRARLESAFDAMLGILRRVPSRLYMKFVKSHFKGEFNSFYHSHTGEFAPNANAICGAQIANAYHIPSISAPPGSGLFFCEKNGQLNITYCWREHSSDEKETTVLLDSLMRDLL